MPRGQIFDSPVTVPKEPDFFLSVLKTNLAPSNVLAGALGLSNRFGIYR